MLNPWFALTIKTMQLGFDAQNVMALRMMRLASGGVRGQNEARRMVTEKIAAGVEAQATAVSAAKPWSPEKSFEAYENGFALTNADCLDADILGGPRFVPPEVVGRERAPAVKEKVIIDS